MNGGPRASGWILLAAAVAAATGLPNPWQAITYTAAGLAVTAWVAARIWLARHPADRSTR